MHKGKIMSLSRLDRPHESLIQYQAELLATINHYIRQRQQIKPHSQGIRRALKLNRLITNQLIAVEGLNPSQLQWRMLDYVMMPDGAGPLQTSKQLRSVILNHLCLHLNISSELIRKVCEEQFEFELKMTKVALMPVECRRAPDIALTESPIKQKLIRSVLIKSMVANDNRSEGKFVEIALQVIRDYKEDAALRFFTGSGIKRAKQLKEKITNQWCDIEKLNEQQVMCRLFEHLAMSHLNDAGLFGSSRILRINILKAMCHYLNVDEAKIKQDSKGTFIYKPHYTHTPWEPLVQVMDSYEVDCQIRLEHVSKELRNRARLCKERVPVVQDDGVEMLRISL
jgi:hypothetical protein